MSLDFRVATELSIPVDRYLRRYVGAGILTEEQVVNAVEELRETTTMGIRGTIDSAKVSMGNLYVKTGFTQREDLRHVVDLIEEILELRTAVVRWELRQAKEKKL